MGARANGWMMPSFFLALFEVCALLASLTDSYRDGNEQKLPASTNHPSIVPVETRLFW
jgi:hypothetical protein